MEVKRIIPCLDLRNGRVVKGMGFLNLRDAGDPLELAMFYEKEGADELVLLDISATIQERNISLQIIEKISEKVKMPLIVGGGIKSIIDIENTLQAGASKVSLGSAAFFNPSLLAEGSSLFGSQTIVVAVDTRYNREKCLWEVYTHGGSRNTGQDIFSWVKKIEKLGIGEILLTSIDHDGQKKGYDLNLLKQVSQILSIPVIASGGAGKKEDFLDLFSKTEAQAALAASIFHYQETSIPEIKNFLKDKGVKVLWKT